MAHIYGLPPPTRVKALQAEMDDFEQFCAGKKVTVIVGLSAG